MKKLFLAFAFLIGFLTTKAQTEKGTILLGGSIAFQTASGSSIFSLNPDLGVFIANNIAIGANLNLTAYSGSTVYSVGPFIRPYFGTSDKGKFFVQGSLLVGGASGSGSGSSTSVGFGAALGYAIFLNKSVALEFKGEYSKLGSGNVGVFGLGAGFQIHYKK